MALYEIVIGIFVTRLLYVIVARLIFSPLSHIPGPKLAALTSWYEFYYDVVKPGQFIWHIQELHLQYGMSIYTIYRCRVSWVLASP